MVPPPPVGVCETQLQVATDSQVHTTLQVQTVLHVHREPPKASWPVSLVLVAWATVLWPALCVCFAGVFGPDSLRLGFWGATNSSGSG